MSETASTPGLDVAVGGLTPAEACAVCGTFLASNRRISVVEATQQDRVRAEAAACPICIEHYGADGVAVRLWPEICHWIPLGVFRDCQCETCTGQIEFRFNAGTDFYD